MGKTIEEFWTLNSGDTTAIPSANRYDGTAAKWEDIWEYQVPSGQAHILKPEHHFSAYINDGIEASNGLCRLEIIIRDQSKQGGKIILGPIMYDACKDFSDVTKMVKLNLTSDLVVEERFYIVIRGLSDAAIDESESYFSLETIRVRSSI